MKIWVQVTTRVVNRYKSFDWPTVPRVGEWINDKAYFLKVGTVHHKLSSKEKIIMVSCEEDPTLTPFYNKENGWLEKIPQ